MDPIEVNEIQGVWSYLKTIDWSDNWLKYLGGFHLLCIVLTVLTRHSTTIQAFYFVFLLLAIYSAEYINEWAATNYKLFSKQQYFDSNGMFVSIVYSCPILFNCLVIVILWLWNTGVLLNEIKRMKIRKMAAAAKQKEDKKDK
ncbi:transmembrane protein 18 [Patella vulgata]|uniref:transmembrane protein 18 n=1 Tax=Patella vulgata TaxID=6465 RepID=UPI0024A91B7C|nr:transmembrane protein 18 [Patella vulgata]